MIDIFKRKSKSAYTVVEVLVAAAIFSGFCLGVFSLYRMGSRMFVSGSWKYNRQKQAERVLEVIKERVEQSSDIISIDPSEGLEEQISTLDTKFVTLTDGKNIQLPANSNQVIAEFVVAKPDQTKLPSAMKGIILYHSISLVPNSDTHLYDLKFRAAADHNDIAFFTSNDDFPPNVGGLSDITRFQGDPVDFGLSPIPYTYTIEDVASLSVSWTYVATSTDDISEKSPLFGITIGMQNPKHAQTTLQLGMKAKIDPSVEIVGKDSL